MIFLYGFSADNEKLTLSGEIKSVSFDDNLSSIYFMIQNKTITPEQTSQTVKIILKNYMMLSLKIIKI